ncbi:unnamed protein product [Trifolium pratense]|uniref:Uncharacterized protein n=1 Tax=Trifolium pratense TaxID=57577 RepID=A0ACB0KV85_TRIPR|nr:unnamed protein product [Trifolium pratense]
MQKVEIFPSEINLEISVDVLDEMIDGTCRFHEQDIEFNLVWGQFRHQVVSVPYYRSCGGSNCGPPTSCYVCSIIL